MYPIKQQSTYSYKLEVSKNNTGVTSFAGLAFLRRSFREIGLSLKLQKVFYKKGYLKRGGYQDHVILECILLLLASGGRCLSDWEYIRDDPGMKKLMKSIPSVDVLERYLDRLGMTELSHSCQNGKVGYSTLLEMIHREMALLIYKLKGSPKKLTLDFDASIFETFKKEALFCYEKVKAYQPMIAYCPELGMVVAHEMRDGNISPQTGYDRLLDRCREIFKEVSLTVRTDSAGYQIAFMDKLDANNIEYFITADEFAGLSEILHKETSWAAYTDITVVSTDQQVSEINYVATFSNQTELKLRRNVMRFIAIRKPKNGQYKVGETPYVYQVICTNSVESNLSKIVQKNFGRCGSVEYAYSQLKSGCGMRRMPSGKFHVNAAWFSMGILAHNIIKILQAYTLPKNLQNIEIKTLTFRFFRSAAMIVNRSRETVIRFCNGHKMHDVFKEATDKLEILHYRLQNL